MSNEDFGGHVRKARKDAGLSLQAVADGLGVSTTYLSDVELGRRSPMSDEKISVLAELLELDAADLRVRAAESRGAFELTPRSPRHREVGALLMRRWDGMDEFQLDEIYRALLDGQKREEPDA